MILVPPVNVRLNENTSRAGFLGDYILINFIDVAFAITNTPGPNTIYCYHLLAFPRILMKADKIFMYFKGKNKGILGSCTF